MTKKLLILGGTHEAYSLAEYLILNFPSEKLITVSSLSGATLNPKIPAGSLRIGGFGGFFGLKNYLINENISIIVNATHPYATQITKNSNASAKELGIPYFRLSRPPWKKFCGDQWIDVPSIENASNFLIENEKSLLNNLSTLNIFLTTGARELDFFKKCNSYNFFVRTADLPKNNTLLPNAKFLQERGKFFFDNEVSLFQKYSIKLLITKNSGGSHTYAKIEASRKLNIPIIMIRRPISSSSETCFSLDETIELISNIIM